MKYLIITLFLFSFLMISVVSFEDAFATIPNPILITDKPVYQLSEEITLTCIIADRIKVSYIYWSIEKHGFYSQNSPEWTSPAELLGIGTHKMNCIILEHDGAARMGSNISITVTKNIISIPILDSSTETKKKTGGSSCPDCVPPTIGTDSQGKRFVDYGVVLNGESFQMGNYKTHIPMMFTEIGLENHLTLKIYENFGAYNIDMVQFAIVKEIGSSMDFEPRFQIDVKNTANDIHNPALVGTELIDKKGIIDNYTVEPSLVDCMEGFTHTCLQLDIYWTFAQVPEFKVLMINGWDNGKSSFTHFLNDGLTVIDPTPIIPEPEEIPKEKECIIYKVAKRINSCQFQPMIDSAIQRAQETMKMIMK